MKMTNRLMIFINLFIGLSTTGLAQNVLRSQKLVLGGSSIVSGTYVRSAVGLPFSQNSNHTSKAIQTSFVYTSLDLKAGESDIAIQVYPNPVQSQLRIEGVISNLNITVQNTLGVEIYSSSDVNFINCDAWNSGVYYIQFQQGSCVKTIKIIKI